MGNSSRDQQQFLDSLESLLDKGVESDLHELEEIPVQLDEYENSGQIEVCEKALELLGTAVGKQNDWQLPFQDSGILGYVVQKLDRTATPIGLAKQYLRIIGNCVADDDDNRSAIVDHMQKLVAFLNNENLIITALAVLLNLCNDYEPAQDEAAKLRLDSIVAQRLAENKIPPAAVDYAVDLLNWTTEALPLLQLKSPASVPTFDHVLDLALNYDEDHYDDYVTICTHYLQNPEFQQELATPELVEKIFNVLLDYESRLQPEDIQDVFRALSGQDAAKSQPIVGNAINMVQLINSLSAISATDAFVKNLNMRSPVIRKVKSKLLSLATSPSTVCACVILGNLAIQDQVSVDMVEDSGLHLTLIGILSARKETALLYAAAGLARHLAFPEENRRVLGEAGLIETCCQLLVNKDPSVRGEAAAILCKLVTSNFENIEQVVYEAMPENIMPAELPGAEVPVHPTILYHMITQALLPSPPLPSMSMKNASIEVGRAIVSILRYLGQPSPEEDVEPVSRHMYKTPLVARPVARLARQRFYAEARSEGLLGLGLLVRTHEGAACVAQEMEESPGLLDALKEIATSGSKEGQQRDGAELSRDQQNVLAFLHGLSINGVNAMGSSTKDDVEALRRELERTLLL